MNINEIISYNIQNLRFSITFHFFPSYINYCLLFPTAAIEDSISKPILNKY